MLLMMMMNIYDDHIYDDHIYNQGVDNHDHDDVHVDSNNQDDDCNVYRSQCQELLVPRVLPLPLAAL